jgi:hypothetical protein
VLVGGDREISVSETTGSAVMLVVDGSGSFDPDDATTTLLFSW